MNIEKTLSQFKEQKDLMEDRIKNGIEANRKGYFKLHFIDKDNKPLTGAKVAIRQKSHDFKFGCNIFKLGCFDNDEDNAKYEQEFAKLFNMATTPLYWSDFEPEEGKMRFEKNSSFIDRRIPPESALEFCKKHNIEVKGHPLFWHTTMPKWIPNDYDEMKQHWIRRLEEISKRYDGVMKSFDCINEVIAVPFFDREYLESDGYRNNSFVDYRFPKEAFDLSAHYFKKSKLVLNEASSMWQKENYRGQYSHYYLIAKDLLNSGARIDTLGFQFHAFNTPDNIENLCNDMFNPKYLYAVMDNYSKLQIPMSVSEITIPGYDDDMQAEILKNLYRIWFSSPLMESIIYWNLGDNCATATETQYKSGLIRSDFSEKPSYKALYDLIHNQWQTNEDITTNDNHIWFKAFYGDYEISVVHNGKEVKRNIHLSKTGIGEFNFIF